MNKSYQPHEGHIPYLLQLFIDYNLYGMNLLNLGAVKFRRSPNKGKTIVFVILSYFNITLCASDISPLHCEMFFGHSCPELCRECPTPSGME